MSVLIGIDEAGYGPLMGPLVISASAFELPESMLGQDHWQILHKAVAKQKRGLLGRILITDSKKAYTRASGLFHLERTVLATLLDTATTPINPNCTVEAFLQKVCPDTLPRLKNYPWYEQFTPQSLSANWDDIQLAAKVLHKTLVEEQIKLLDLRSRCLDVAYYNERVEAIKNKSRASFTEICILIHHYLQSYDTRQTPMQIIVDRQGGRIDYHNELLRMFPDQNLKVLRQNPTISSYELTGDTHNFKIHFATKADQKHLPVALASMLSKYIRELMMHSLNDFFTELHNDLKPTAGYWQDGQRFIKELLENNPTFTQFSGKLIRIK